ncbi:xanthine dehydrogenase family protein molybdopterin-binding subunit [Oscillibacter sp. MSJ-31]|uniref:xanthine dehydrogenase family protein molybdopterin-binding subunit n=1 Tax=Oscillibacter sp. MSJ-31 TaxID=2841526 RepID=UPI001C11AC66|nr:xanthine dehydrogenase family protein molybdopterin-binding subunit [Oscillibacter sp. MSJ-31]MBU5456485.1 xanthine dehydrogenase family protein molybdopterin-binding subunit [Oscillibacter sp. MSJ-31]
MSEGYSSKPMQATKIGDRIVRVDAVQKARGEAVYVCDMTLPNMQYAYMVRSTIARGRIKAIHVPELPEGYHFISAKDIPAQGKNELWMISKDWRCFAEDYVLYVGETIGLVVGPDRSVLKRLKAQIKIDYEEQTPAVTIDDGIHCVGGPMFPEKNSNVMCELFCEKGRPMDEVFAEADEVFEETIETPYQEHVHLETNSAIADMEDGKFVFYASAQCPFYIRKSIAGLLDIPYDDIIVRQCTTGGAFGGKEHFPDVLCGALLVAENKIRKPIKMVFDREEDTQFSVKRHPSKCIYKTAVKDGKITGVYGHIYYNCGAYLSSSYVVLQRGVFHGNGVYTFDNTYLKGEGIGTNMFPSCAFRGFGAPQTLFAIETHLDHLAHHLGVDPLEFKMQYLAKKGDETTTNGHIIEEVKLPEMLDVITRESDYWRKAKEYKPGCGRGIGIALYNHGGAFTGNGEQAIIKAHARLVKTGDRVSIQVGSTEMGQGFKTSLRKICAATLGVSIDQIEYLDPDTSKVVDSGPTAASRSTMVVGRLVERAAQEMKERWSEGDFTTEVEYEHPDGYPWDQATFRGDAYLGYGWGVACVEAEVDRLTNEVKTVGVWSSHEIGKAIDELIVHGQINGGILQSLGYGSMEKLEVKGGRFKQKSMSDYVIPTSMDFPKQFYHIQENPYPWGPYGAKGMGELVFNGASAAYVDAVERALNTRFTSIPIPPEAIEEAMKHVH